MNDRGDEAAGLTIADAKIHLYLLNPHHPKGRAKCRFLTGRGFDAADPRPLIVALFNHAKPDRLVHEFDDAFGRKFVYEGPLQTPDGRNPTMRSVWHRATGDSRRLFCTLYPI